MCSCDFCCQAHPVYVPFLNARSFVNLSIPDTEHHAGMIVAIAFESVIKLVAFLAVGVFVTFGLFDGFGDLAEHGD